LTKLCEEDAIDKRIFQRAISQESKSKLNSMGFHENNRWSVATLGDLMMMTFVSLFVTPKSIEFLYVGNYDLYLPPSVMRQLFKNLKKTVNIKVVFEIGHTNNRLKDRERLRQMVKSDGYDSLIHIVIKKGLLYDSAALYFIFIIASYR